jgi:CheY-like chemotaxis protein
MDKNRKLRDMIVIINTLIVDDGQEVRNTLVSILEDVGYLVQTAENGKKLSECARRILFMLPLSTSSYPT